MAVTITGADGAVREFTADWPERAEVTLDLPDMRLRQAFDAGALFRFEPPQARRLTVTVTPDGRRPLAMEARVATRPEDRDVITAQDRELLDPVLGDERMTALMERDREAWTLAGALVARAFTAGKRATREERKP